MQMVELQLRAQEGLSASALGPEASSAAPAPNLRISGRLHGRIDRSSTLHRSAIGGLFINGPFSVQRS